MKNVFKTLGALALTVVVAGSSLTVDAAPKKMADGTMFDAQFYATTYPDVVAALGTSEKALYSHYQKFGKAEGRLAMSATDANNLAVTASAQATVSAAPVRVIPEFAKQLNTQINNEVVTGQCLVDYATGKKKPPRDPNAKQTSFWYRPFYQVFQDIYGVAISNDKWAKSDFLDGRLMTEIVDDNYGFGSGEMLLDFGYYTEYIDYWKARGVVSADYQLPDTFYTLKNTGKLGMSGVRTIYGIETECPEAMYVFYKHIAYYLVYNGYITAPALEEPTAYVPKYIRDQAAKASVN